MQLHKIDQQRLGFNFGVLQFFSTFHIHKKNFDCMYKGNIHNIKKKTEIYFS